MVAQHCWFGMKLFQAGKFFFFPKSLLQMLQDCKGLHLVPKPTFLAWVGPIGMNILGNVVVKEIILNLCSSQAEMPYLVLLFRGTGRCSKACSNQKPNFLQIRSSSQHHKVSIISRVAGRSGACASSSTTQSSNSEEASAPAKDWGQGGKRKSCSKLHPASITHCEWMMEGWAGCILQEVLLCQQVLESFCVLQSPRDKNARKIRKNNIQLFCQSILLSLLVCLNLVRI